MKCIYTEKDEKIAMFKKREHVFPAGIGGKNMLNQGDVCDEINEFFSKLELNFMRESIIQIPRMFVGPGKRGSLNKKKATKSKVFLMYTENESKLGYILLGNPIIIPQIKIIKDKEIRFRLPVKNKEENIETILKFEELLNKSENIKLNKSNRLEEESIIIGYNNSKKEKIYIYHNRKDISLTKLKSMFKEAGVFKKIKQEYKEENLMLEKQSVECEMKISFDVNDYYRICCKIAINGLCYLKGSDFLFDKRFDNIKKFILEGGENRFFNIIEQKEDHFGFCKRIKLPTQSHKMIFIDNDDGFYCYLEIYGIAQNIRISEKLNENDDILGLVCDWENAREFTLREYILEKIEQEDFMKDYYSFL